MNASLRRLVCNSLGKRVMQGGNMAASINGDRESATPILPASAGETGAVLSNEVQLGIELGIIGANPDRETRHMPDVAGGAGVKIGEEHVAIPRQAYRRPIPVREAGNVQPVFQNLRRSGRKNFRVCVEAGEAIGVAGLALLRKNDTAGVNGISISRE